MLAIAAFGPITPSVHFSTGIERYYGLMVYIELENLSCDYLMINRINHSIRLIHAGEDHLRGIKTGETWFADSQRLRLSQWHH